MTYAVGIDLGTSAVKVLVIDADGATVAKTRAPYPLKHPAPDRTEQSCADWWQATCDATRRAVAGLDAAAIGGVGLSGQLNALILLDAQDEPLDDAWIWLDLRAREDARRFNDRHPELLRRAIVNPANPIFVATKLAWMHRERPDLGERLERIAFAKDVINHKLTGVLATDHSDASCSLLYDLQSGRWMPELLELAGLRDAQLPVLRASDDVIGTVTRTAANETGLPAGTPVVAGAGDVAALALGSGTLLPGTCSITLGTAGHVVTARRETTPAGYNRIWQMRHALPDLILHLGLVMSGGLSLSWFAREFSQGGDVDAALGLLPDTLPGARGVTFLPFLEGAATPYQDPDLSAGFFGLRTHHTRADMVRAVLEGVAYNVRDCVEVFVELGSGIDEVRLSEGGSRSAAWCQIIADVLQRPVTTLRELDSSALGAAMLALRAATGGDLADLARGVTRNLESARFEPERVRSGLYDGGYERYRALTAAMQAGR